VRQHQQGGRDSQEGQRKIMKIGGGREDQFFHFFEIKWNGLWLIHSNVARNLNRISKLHP